MVRDVTRRRLLQSIGALGGALAVGPQVVGASVAEDRWICDMSHDAMSMSAMGDVEVLMDLREEIGYCMVECVESELPADAPVDYDEMSFDLEKDKAEFSQEDLQQLLDIHENGGLPYAPDVELELAEPQAAADSGLNAADTVDDGLYDLQWDKQSQRIGQVHETATGEGARIGIIDDGVLGANPDSDASHPDLPNVREDLSFNFTFDGEGPGPLNDDHGTHVAGTAAAASNGEGVVGVAPDAEVVDLRVFSGATASTFGIVGAIIVGSLPEDSGGSGCDAVNLSLGIPTLPVCTFIGLLVLIFFYPLYEFAAEFALDNDCLPVASAGNSATNLADPTAGGFCAPPLDFEIFGESGFFTLPASVDEYLTVGATGPIGFGWGTSPGRGGGRGKGSSKTEEVIPGFDIEKTIQTELFPEEPSFYTNYGGNGEVNVTAGGGNLDLDAAGAADQGNYFYDLVFNTGFVTDDSKPEDARLDDYTPSYAWKAGTSFSAPQVTGLAALLKGANPDASAGEICDAIESTAKQRPVGKSGQTTSPETFPNILGQTDGTGVQDDGVLNGDTPSNPGSNEDTLDSAAIRGSGHIDVGAAVDAITDD